MLDREEREPDVLEQRGLERVGPVVLEPGPAERAVLAHAVRAPVELRDDGLALGKDRRVRHIESWISSIVARPVGVPLSSSTTTSSAPSVSMIERASRSVVEAGARGSPLGVPTSSRSRSASRCSDSRFSARSRPTKLATKSSAGAARMFSGRVVLGEHAAFAQDDDPVAHLDRLVDVVGHEDDRLANLLLQAQELVLQALAGDRVDRAERLVHEHQRRVDGQGAGEADALALAARQLGGVALAQARARGRRARAAPPRACACGPGPSRAAAGRSRCCR